MRYVEHPVGKIYSRKRLNFDFLKYKNNNGFNKYINKSKREKRNKKKVIKKTVYIIIVFLIIIAFGIILKSINPVFDTLCKEEARYISTIITNEETTKVMNKYNYETFFNIEKNDSGEIQMISANVLKINKIISDIALEIQKSLRKNENRNVSIAMGNLSGIRIFSGFGPKIPIKLSFAGDVETDLKSEFVAQGVNQTIHRVYLDVNSKVSILTPFYTIEENVNNQVLILENLILGKIPSNYYNLNGMDNSSEALELVE